MKNYIFPVLLVALTAGNASAAVTTTFSQMDPGSTLENYTSNTWDVTTSSDPWLSAALLVQLTGGDIYQDDNGSDAPPDPADFGTYPALEYDSYMTGGTDSVAPSTIGPAPDVLGGAVDIGGAIPATFDTSLIDASWVSSLATNPSGNLMLGRVTLSDDAQGIYSYRVDVDGQLPSSFEGGFIVNGAMTEPILTSTFTQVDTGSTPEGYTSNTWDVNTLGDAWLSAALLVELTSGDIYQDVNGDENPPDPALFGTYLGLEYDSYMTGRRDSELPSTIGPAPDVLGGAVDIGGAIPVTFSTSGIDASWVSSLATNPAGELMLARITLSDNAQGTYKFRIDLDQSGATFFLGGQIVDGAMTSAVTPAGIGDFNSDGVVNAADFTVWQDNLGLSASALNGNGSGAATVVQADYLLWAQNFTGLGASSSAAVPEPSALLLLFVVLSALWFVRLH